MEGLYLTKWLSWSTTVNRSVEKWQICRCLFDFPFKFPFLEVQAFVLWHKIQSATKIELSIWDNTDIHPIELLYIMNLYHLVELIWKNIRVSCLFERFVSPFWPRKSCLRGLNSYIVVVILGAACWEQLVKSSWMDSNLVKSTQIDSDRLRSTQIDSNRLELTWVDSNRLKWARIN